MKTGFEKAKRPVWQCGSLLLTAVLLPSAIALGQTQPPAKPEPAPIRPFTCYSSTKILARRRQTTNLVRFPFYPLPLFSHCG
jgi:hypothetical protein